MHAYTTKHKIRQLILRNKMRKCECGVVDSDRPQWSCTASIYTMFRHKSRAQEGFGQTRFHRLGERLQETVGFGEMILLILCQVKVYLQESRRLSCSRGISNPSCSVSFAAFDFAKSS